MLKRTKSKGLKALIDCNKISVDDLNTYHIGFRIGPCLNASGRLDTAKRALELLRAKTKGEADVLAGDLKALNDSRKEMTVQAIEDAIEQIEGSSLRNDKVLVVFLPECHESLAGIVAGKIREKYYRPTIILTRTEEGLKGSGRSIEAYHMYEELNRCKYLLTKFGGHKLAAGMSLKEENLEKFRTLLNVNTTLTEDDMIPKVLIDMQLPIEYIDEDLVEQLQKLEPFGKGNQQPLFAEKDLEILNPRICGQNQNTVRMRVRSKQGRMMDAVYFGDAAEFLAYFEKKGSKIGDFTYNPSVDEFYGRRNLQITVQNYR